MEERIRHRLECIEKDENVRILLAVESGSRTWGFASKDSDYDVRFIYARQKNDYLKLAPMRDVIEYPISDDLDINGWDIRKTLILLKNSNPAVYEWLNSPIVYKNSGFADMLRSSAGRWFSPKKAAYHYISIAERHYEKYLVSEEVRAKKYFYALRLILACRWTAERMTPPPVPFAELADAYLPAYMRDEADKLISIKQSTEIKTVKKIPVVDEYIRQSISELRDIPGRLPDAEDTGYPEELFLAALGI